MVARYLCPVSKEQHYYASKGLTKLLFQLFLSFPTVVFLSYWQLLDGGEPRFSLMDFLYIFFIRSARHQKLPNTVVHTKVDRSLLWHIGIEEGTLPGGTERFL